MDKHTPCGGYDIHPSSPWLALESNRLTARKEKEKEKNEWVSLVSLYYPPASPPGGMYILTNRVFIQLHYSHEMIKLNKQWKLLLSVDQAHHPNDYGGCSHRGNRKIPTSVDFNPCPADGKSLLMGDGESHVHIYLFCVWCTVFHWSLTRTHLTIWLNKIQYPKIDAMEAVKRLWDWFYWQAACLHTQAERMWDFLKNVLNNL